MSLSLAALKPLIIYPAGLYVFNVYSMHYCKLCLWLLDRKVQLHDQASKDDIHTLYILRDRQATRPAKCTYGKGRILVRGVGAGSVRRCVRRPGGLSGGSSGECAGQSGSLC